MVSDLGKNIRRLREEQGLIQRDFAKILNIGNTTLSQYESGTRVPSDEVKVKIADYFGVTIDYLIGRTNRKSVVIVDDVEKGRDVLDFIYGVLVETGQITQEEAECGIQDEEKKQRILSKVKKAIEFAKDMNGN